MEGDMRLTNLRIQNYRSIVDSGEINIEPLQAFVGENNAGKSNILNAIQVFLTSGTGGITEADLFDIHQAHNFDHPLPGMNGQANGIEN